MAVEVQAFEDTQFNGFFSFADNKNKSLFISYKAYDPERPGYKDKPTPQVNVDLVVLEEDGSFTEYQNQWLKGAAILSFFLGSKSGKVKPKEPGFNTVQKLVQLPPRDGNDKGSWAFKGTDRASYDALVEYVNKREEAVAEAVASEGNPWD